MAIHGLFGFTDRLLHRALDGAAMRQRVTAHNIANVDTPGYKRYRLDFESVLKAAVKGDVRPGIRGKTTHPRHIPIGRIQDPLSAPFKIKRDVDTSMRNDGNNVDIEAEIAQLTKDQVLYSALVEQARRRYAMLRDAITEGRS